MKKFNFRLEALLKMKKHIEKEKQKKLAISMKKVLKQKSQLNENDQTNEQVKQRQNNRTVKPFSVAEMLIYSRYIHKLKRDRLMGEQMLNVLEKDEENKRSNLMQAVRERKKYARLKDKQKDKYYQNIQEKINKETDEIAANSFRLKKSKM